MKLITVGITRHSESDNLLLNCLKSLFNQKKSNFDVLVLDQKNSSKVKNFCENNSNNKIKFIYHKIKPNGVSEVRNYLMKIVETKYLLFTEPDGQCDPLWVYNYLDTFKRTNASLVGGRIEPKWLKKPLFICKSRFVREFYSLLELGNREFRIRKVIGANFGMNVSKIKDANLDFALHLGRKNGHLLGGEETEMAFKANKLGLKVIYNGKILLTHIIPKNRINYKWIWKRSFYGGLSKVKRKRYLFDPFNKKYAFSDYFHLSFIAPSYLLGYIYGLILKLFKL